jgi:hypothetical protein
MDCLFIIQAIFFYFEIEKSLFFLKWHLRNLRIAGRRYFVEIV